VGWGWTEAISKYHDLWVLTEEGCREEIEAELQRRPDLKQRMHFHYIAKKRFFLADVNGSPTHLYNYRTNWQTAAYSLGKRLHEEIGFDIVHQLTYVGFRVPGFLWKLNPPFVWGPIGGLEQTTWALLPSLGPRGALHYTARNIINEWDRRVLMNPKRAFAKAAGGIIAATSGIQREIRRFYGVDSTVISEIGLPPVTWKTPTQRKPDEPLALLWCGLLLPGKALQFLLFALHQLPLDLDWRLTVIGDGPSKAQWQKLAEANGTAHRYEWLGQVPRAIALQRMREAHALVITSVKDLTSTVLVEALASGLPVICPDHCGFADAITPACGIKVPADSKQNIVHGLRDAIIQMNDEDLRLRLGAGALTRSLAYDWDIKGKAVSDIYYRKRSSSAAPHQITPTGTK
jgi:glycosyltransferase involved in cell wall biosynthesis